MTTAENVAWAAGVFEGEGSVYLRKFVRGKAQITHTHGGFRVQMTDKDVVDRLRDVVGVGNVVPCKPTGLGKKPSWAWQVQDRKGFSIVANLLRPHLGLRRTARLAEVESQLTWRDGWWRA